MKCIQVLFISFSFYLSAHANVELRKAQPKKECRQLDFFKMIQKSRLECFGEVKKFMDIDDIDRYGRQPIHVAVEQNKLNFVKLLIYHGADVNSVNIMLETPRNIAARYGHREVLDFLEAVHIETNRLKKAIELGRVNHVKGALIRGASTGARDVRDDTVLHKAAIQGNVAIGNLLVKRKSVIESKNYLGNTPLHEAILNKNFEFAKLLIKNGANINARNNRRQTALDLAIVWSDTFQKYLKKNGAKEGRFIKGYSTLDVTISGAKPGDPFSKR